MRGRVRQIGMVLASWTGRWWWAVLLGGVLVAAYLARDISNYSANRAAEYRALPAVATAIATAEPKDRLAFERDLLQYETDSQIKIWTGMVQAVGAVVLAIGAYFAWRNLRVANEAQITNRFTQAIGQLGGMKDKEPNLEVRLGGIYALERIAKDSPRDHWTIMEVLTAYVRQNANWTPPSSQDDGVTSNQVPQVLFPPSSVQRVGSRKPYQDLWELRPLRTDIQAILTVLGRRKLSDNRPEPAPLDLRGTNLRGAILDHAHLEGALLEDAHLEGALLWGAHLSNARLSDAHLDGATLNRAHLDHACLSHAHLENAFLKDAHLNGADLAFTNLKGASLVSSDLARVNLWGANLTWANLTQVSLEGAHLDEADLSQAINMSGYQLNEAASRSHTRLPEHLAHMAERAVSPP